MVIRCGIDLVLNKRLEKNFSNPEFLKKVFHASELRTPKNLIGIFTLKEAVMKALGEKINWLGIEVKVREGKKPIIFVGGKNFKVLDCSVSHDGEYTVGMVVVEDYKATKAK
jgi:phosphopantetheine--protein transferase-like protein